MVIDPKARTHYRTLLENEYLGQWDLMRQDGTSMRPTVVIDSVDVYRPQQRRTVKLPDGRRGVERMNKLIIGFKGKRKRWISGPVTQTVIASMYGPIIQDWLGKPITIYVDPEARFGRKKVGGIRVENRAPTEEPTSDPLDNEVDEERAAVIAEAFDEGT